jgi:hypothetical protein
MHWGGWCESWSGGGVRTGSRRVFEDRLAQGTASAQENADPHLTRSLSKMERFGEGRASKIDLGQGSPEMPRATARPMTTLLGKFVLYALACASFWTLSLPAYLDVAAFVGLLIICVRLRLGDFTLVVGGLLVGLLALNAIARVLADTGAIATTYREHEMFMRTGQVYEASVDATVFQPHGDLLAIDPLAPAELRQPRTVHFRTDSLGYRNSSGYNGQRNVLVGDSFTVGNGTDWPETLSPLLAALTGVDSYQIGFPSAPIDYERRAAWFVSMIDPQARLSFFIFEGNDFENSTGQMAVLGSPRPMLPAWVAAILNQYDRIRTDVLRPLWTFLAYSPIAYSASRRIERTFIDRDLTQVSTYRIGGKLMGFYEPQNIASVDPHPALILDMNPNVLRRTACIFFVPSKLRVYREQLPESAQRQIAEPSPAYEVLARAYAPYELPVIDLTPILRQAAASNLAADKYVFWRDDTHWNGLGMAAVAPTVAECIRSPLRASNLHGDAVPGWEFSFDGTKLSRTETDITIGDFGQGRVEAIAPDNQNLIIEGWATSKDGTRSAERVLAFVGTQLVSSAPTRIAKSGHGSAIGPGARTPGFQLAIPRNLVKDGLAGVRIFSLHAKDRAAELTLPEESRSKWTPAAATK